MTSLSLAVFAVLILNLQAQARLITLVSSPNSQTNSFEVQNGEVAKLVSFPAEMNTPNWTRISIQKDGATFSLSTRNANNANGAGSVITRDPVEQVVVVGPARITLIALNLNENPSTAQGICTFELSPDTFSADKTITLAPGAGGAAVTLECSTDLVHWASATNGTYTNLPSAKFFRIKADRLP